MVPEGSVRLWRNALDCAELPRKLTLVVVAARFGDLGESQRRADQKLAGPIESNRLEKRLYTSAEQSLHPPFELPLADPRHRRQLADPPCTGRLGPNLGEKPGKIVEGGVLVDRCDEVDGNDDKQYTR